MKKSNSNLRERVEEKRAGYNAVKGVRGKYADRFKAESGCYLVSVDIGLWRYFPDNQSVNAALHGLVELAQREPKSKPRRKSA